MSSPTQCRFTEIFKAQCGLMRTYHQIEAANGQLTTHLVPVNIHDRFGQARLKDFAWRVTEELGEAFQALIDYSETAGTVQDEKFREEMIDAFHFLVELAILSDLYPGEIVHRTDPEVLIETSGDLLDCWLMTVSPEDQSDGAYMSIFDVILQLCRAMHCLKNRPWKQSTTVTDVESYRNHLASAFHSFAIVLVVAGFTSQQVYDLYFAKNAVNKERQSGGY